MTISVGARSGRRYYDYGEIKSAILAAINDEPQSCFDITVQTHLPRHIVVRNLAALTSRGILRNVGTRSAALYVKNGEAK